MHNSYWLNLLFFVSFIIIFLSWGSTRYYYYGYTFFAPIGDSFAVASSLIVLFVFIYIIFWCFFDDWLNGETKVKTTNLKYKDLKSNNINKFTV